MKLWYVIGCYQPITQRQSAASKNNLQSLKIRMEVQSMAERPDLLCWRSQKMQKETWLFSDNKLMLDKLFIAN